MARRRYLYEITKFRNPFSSVAVSPPRLGKGSGTSELLQSKAPRILRAALARSWRAGRGSEDTMTGPMEIRRQSTDRPINKGTLALPRGARANRSRTPRVRYHHTRKAGWMAHSGTRRRDWKLTPVRQPLQANGTERSAGSQPTHRGGRGGAGVQWSGRFTCKRIGGREPQPLGFWPFRGGPGAGRLEAGSQVQGVTGDGPTQLPPLVTMQAPGSPHDAGLLGAQPRLHS